MLRAMRSQDFMLQFECSKLSRGCKQRRASGRNRSLYSRTDAPISRSHHAVPTHAMHAPRNELVLVFAVVHPAPWLSGEGMLHQTSHKSCLPRRHLQSTAVGNCSESSIAGYLTSIQEPCQLSPADRCCCADGSEAKFSRTYHCFAKLSVCEAPLLGIMADVVVGRCGA